MLQCAHLIQNTPQGPHVRLGVVGVPRAQLRAEVIRCADASLGEVGVGSKHSCHTKVTDLQAVALNAVAQQMSACGQAANAAAASLATYLTQKHVRRLDVSMEDALCMQVPQAKSHLDE